MSNLPKIFSGIPRSGTTHIHLNYWRQQVIDNPHNFPGFVDESYRILPIYDNIEQLEIPRLNYQPDEEFQLASMISYQGFGLSNTPTQQYFEKIREKISLYKKYPHDKVSQKIFGFDYWLLMDTDKEWVTELVQNNHFVYVMRKNYVRSVASYMYAAAIDKFHFFKEPDIKLPEVFLNVFGLKDIMTRNILSLSHLMRATPNFEIIYIEDYVKKDNFEEYNNAIMNVDKKYLLPPSMWAKTPLRLSKDYAQLATNYSVFEKKCKEYMLEICEKSLGVFEIVNDELTVNVERLG